ncbi:hypothetical protein QZH46_27785 [Pseudomonas corrugata]|jgi:hypothetical protein|uniref:hypothetical protein n=1 Tax=Pseudomonas brassicacearum TaxID=930166 RepID=UPI000F4A2901|nr:hypothetical protein [Pseudomonas brassicacearum]QEO80890.1 hypothetical protein ELZ14_26320 [Pseudomonas brassicacearum]ROM80044.1 hypothetical protein BK655_18765 [Pseudomonas brassicacearum]
MSRKIANKALMHPFSILRQIGFSPRLMQRLERYRTEQKRLKRDVMVMRWADGIWCALSVPCEAPRAIIVDEGQQIDAYEDARACLDGDLLPFVSLRWEVNA